jgi:hypothetical protein
MDYQFAIKGFSLPALPDKPIITIKAGTGAPCLLLRVDVGFRAASSAWEGLVIRKVDSPATGGTAVNATAHDGDWTVAPQAVVTKGTFDVDPTLIASGTAGAEKGLFTLNAVGYLPWSPAGSFERIPAGATWAICTPDAAPGAQTVDILITIRE